jgi:endonuclease/exonuclease/phosphatase family metal-dependent hydrolase
MKKTVILFCAFILVLSCKKDEPDYSRRTSYFKNIAGDTVGDSLFTCVTFNIHLGFRANQDPWNREETGAGMDQVKEIARHLKIAGPDFVALQEVPRNRSNAVVKEFLEALAAEMNMNYAFGAHGYNDPYGVEPVKGEWGTAVLSRYRILGITNTEVEYVSVWERRSMLDVLVEISPSETIHVMSLHYLPSDQGIPNTAGYLQQVEGPVILMGDFNYTGAIPEFTASGLKDADSAYQTGWIDRIFYSGGHFTCKGYGTIADTAHLISDHAANFCILVPR